MYDSGFESKDLIKINDFYALPLTATLIYGILYGVSPEVTKFAHPPAREVIPHLPVQVVSKIHYY